jgi:tripartite-type tricarboxylate transporter receptor subunit TctC
MKLARRSFLQLAAGAAVLSAGAPQAWSQTYPSRPLRLILGYGPGAAPDIVARLIGQWLSERLGQPFVIDNRPGAGSNIGTEAVVHSPADGYTLLYITTANATNTTLYEKLSFDFNRDIAPVAATIRVPNLVTVNPAFPAKTLAEFIAYVKANPGKLTFGSGGIGTPAHLAGELLKVEAGIEMTHAPFRGTGQALQSVIGGHVPIAFNPPSPLLPHLESGALRAIAVTTLQRTSALPNVPTIAESGYPGFDAATWHAIVGPAGLPKDVLAALHNALHETLNDAATRKALTDLGVDVVNSSPDQLRAYIKLEIPKWAKVVKASGAKVK